MSKPKSQMEKEFMFNLNYCATDMLRWQFAFRGMTEAKN